MTAILPDRSAETLSDADVTAKNTLEDQERVGLTPNTSAAAGDPAASRARSGSREPRRRDTFPLARRTARPNPSAPLAPTMDTGALTWRARLLHGPSR